MTIKHWRNMSSITIVGDRRYGQYSNTKYIIVCRENADRTCLEYVFLEKILLSVFYKDIGRYQNTGNLSELSKVLFLLETLIFRERQTFRNVKFFIRENIIIIELIGEEFKLAHSEYIRPAYILHVGFYENYSFKLLKRCIFSYFPQTYKTVYEGRLVLNITSQDYD